MSKKRFRQEELARTTMDVCPRCGSENVELADPVDYGNPYVFCNECYFMGPEKGSPERARAAWNRITRSK